MNIVYIVAYNREVIKVFSDLETAEDFRTEEVWESDVPELWSVTAYPIER